MPVGEYTDAWYNTPMKTCTKCGEEKPATTEYFYLANRKDRPNILIVPCRKCRLSDAKVWREANPGRMKEYQKEYQRGYYLRNRDAYQKRSALWAKTNPERAYEFSKRWAENNPTYRVSKSISRGIAYTLAGRKGRRPWVSLVDFSLTEFIRHMELKFTDGMSWDNYGEWHIDHIRPVASFTFTSHNDPDFKRCWSLSNLQPLWAFDNLSKGSKVA